MSTSSYNKIKGVIMAAGYGTRFLPASKTVPKELFPLIDVPTIDFTVREFLDAGIKDILIITSRRKKVLEDYLDHEMELEWILQQEGKQQKLAEIKPFDANFSFVRQREMRGTADALRLCQPFCGNSPFVVAYPDDIVLGGSSCAGELIAAYKRTGKTVLAARELPNEDVSRYGVIDCDRIIDGLREVHSIIEKPKPGTEPSKVVSFGRYLYTPEIFDALDTIPPSVKGESSQTEPLNVLASKRRVIASEFSGERFDVGAPFGYLVTTIEYALKRKELAEPFRKYLKANLDRIVNSTT